LENLDVDEGIILKWILRKQGIGMWTGYIWLLDGDQRQAFVIAVMNKVFHKEWAIHWLHERLSAVQQTVCSMEFVSPY
jgi:hypothetical protein